MRHFQAAALAAALLFPASSWADGGINARPGFLRGQILSASYDGVADDLLTAGLGAAGIQGAAPGFADPLNPSAAELRRRAIYNNYRALVDVTSAGGYGRLFGPDVGLDGAPLPEGGKVAGEEHLAYAGAPGENVTLMVQIPAAFDPANACIVTAASSGSRGVYGAIGTAGDWGLKRGCAVAYTDKGTGTGAHDLHNDRVNLIDGVVTAAADAGSGAQFIARLTAAQRADFNAASPNRWAFKHAHSQRNPEQDWGRHVLWAVEFAFYMLNEKFGERDAASRLVSAPIRPANTLVIASSVSNGAGAALAAAEQDRHGLIDGVAVSEPQIQTRLPRRLVIARGGVPVAAQGSPLYDYTTVANLYQPCAAIAQTASPLSLAANPAAANRCAALKAKGLIDGDDLPAQSAAALAKLRAAGWEADSDPLHASHYALATPAIAVTYANAYNRARVSEKLCGFSFAATDATGAPAPLAAAAAAQIFANANGIPPSAGVNLINDAAVGGPRLDAASVSPSTGALDFNVDGALCLRNLWTLSNAAGGGRPSAESLVDALRVRDSVRRVLVQGNLRGKPALVVQGRADTLVPVNHASRAWYGANLSAERGRSRARYYEVTNAQHFDAFLPLPGYDTRFVPLHVYFVQALNLMYEHLKNGAPLPPSQLVRTTPRGGSTPAPALQVANLPPIAAAPDDGDLIRFEGNTLNVPE